MATAIDTNSSSAFQLLQIDSVIFGVPAREVLSVVTWSTPTPLPFAPELVLGVVSVQGRMFTVVDSGKLLGINTSEPARFIVTLGGDEQLALTVDEAKDVIEVDQPLADSNAELIQRSIQINGQEILLLDTNLLFPRIIRGRERRSRGL